MMRIMSDYREAMWGVIQQGTVHAGHRLRRRGQALRPALAFDGGRRFEVLEQAAERSDVPTDVPTEVRRRAS